MNVIRRRTAALLLGIAALVPTVGVNPANAIFFVGTCQLHVVFHLSQPIGFGTLGNPSYWIEVNALGGGMSCQLTDNVLDPLRYTYVAASGNSTVFDCDVAVGAGGWSQEWVKGNGQHSPPSVDGGRHKLFGTFGDWLLEVEGPNPVRFAGVIALTLDTGRAGSIATDCANGSLWELSTIGTQVFQDPEV